MKFKTIDRKIRGIKNRMKFAQVRDNRIEVDPDVLPNLSLRIDGRNNTVHLSNLRILPSTFLHIRICGDHNLVCLNDVGISESLEITMGQRHLNFSGITGSQFKIGGGSSIESLSYLTYNSHAVCEIGRNCMFSFDITLYNTDGHPIFSTATGKIVNWVDGIKIGDHCWVGKGATILKNSVVPDDCIIGYNAVVSGHLKESHAAYAGNPARLIKTGITWDPNGVKAGYCENSEGRQFSKK